MSFNQIKGQDIAIKILQNYLKTNNFASGYIFYGPSGVGKKLVAKNFAKAINCLEIKNDACDRCISCQKIEKNNHPDVHLLENRENTSIKIDEIRLLQKELNLKPYEAKKKIFIIDNAQMLTPEAANSLLKSLEEPPPETIFILITSELKKIFPTILSRCQKITFLPLTKEKMQNILQKDYNFSNTKAQSLSLCYEGRLGKAVGENFNIFEEKNKVIEFFLEGGYKNNSEFIKFEDKEKFRNSLIFLLSLYRDIWFVKLGLFSDLINLDIKEKIINVKNDYTFLELENKIQFICNLEEYLEQNVNYKLLFNILKINLCKK